MHQQENPADDEIVGVSIQLVTLPGISLEVADYHDRLLKDSD